jgi:hypothetical protein
VRCTQRVDGGLQRTAVVVLLVGLAVAQEAATLVDVKKRTGELAGRQGLVESLGAQCIRVQALQCLALCFVGREEAHAHQRLHQPRLALEQPVAPAPHRPRGAACDGER